MLVSHEWVVSGGPGVRPWAGGASMGRASCRVGRVCICGQGVMSGGLGVCPWAGLVDAEPVWMGRLVAGGPPSYAR